MSEIPREPLLCPVCEKPIEKGEFFIVVIECVTEFVCNETPVDGGAGIRVPRRPVHLTCIANARTRVPILGLGDPTGGRQAS